MSAKIRQKPPPKPPRMKPSMLDQSSISSDTLCSHREGSPGIISLRSVSVADSSHSLDASLRYGGDLLTSSDEPTPTLTRKDHLQNILAQTRKFFMLKVELDDLVMNVNRKITNSKLNSITVGDEETKWNRLVNLVLSEEKAGLMVLSDVLRNRDHDRLADIMLVLSKLLDIGLSKDSCESVSASLCSVCDYNQSNDSLDESISSCSKFDVEIICIDSESGQVISLKNVPSGKRSSRNRLSVEEKMLVKDNADRYVPALAISIVNQCLCHQGMQQLADLLQRYSCIYELAIVKNHLNIHTIKQLFGRVGKMYDVSKLDLRLNNLDDECAEMLFGCLIGNTSLQVVNIASTGLTATGLTHLLSALGKSKTLTELDIGFNSIHNTGARSMSQVLSTNGELCKLRMKSNYITSDGAKWIFQALKKNSRLSILDISGNLFKDAGCQFISEALLCNRTLRELNLEGCCIGKPGCEYLARAMKTNTTLKYLDLSRNPLKDEGVEALSEGIKYNQVLDVLCLNMCEIANCGFAKLMDALQYNMTMTTLKLCYNLIGYPVTVDTDKSPTNESVRVPTVRDIYERVCQILQTNKDLKVLLWGNRLDCDDEQENADNGLDRELIDSSSNILNDDIQSICSPLCAVSLSKQVSHDVRQAIFETPFGSPLGKRVFSESSALPYYSETNNNVHSK